MIVQPGASFTLDIRVQGDAAEQQQVHKALADRLEAAGMTVGNGGPVLGARHRHRRENESRIGDGPHPWVA